MIQPYEDELYHYRTPGSRNGVRLYQNKDGTLTYLGRQRYLKGEKNRSLYYDPSYKPNFFYFYDKDKQKELKKQIQDNGGNKNYKGYERAEMKDAYTTPGKTNYEIKADKEKKRLQKEFNQLAGEALFNLIYTPIKNKIENRKQIGTPQIEPEVEQIVNNVSNKSLVDDIVSSVNIDAAKQWLLNNFSEFATDPRLYLGKKAFNWIREKIRHDSMPDAQFLIDEDIYENDELKHWGIEGMKWGIRRYQNEDGSLTPEGRIRYSKPGTGKQNYIDDNWKRASKQVEEQMKSDPKYQKFMDKSYKEFRDEDDIYAFSKYYDPNVYIQNGKVYDDGYADYYTILWGKTQEFLEREYETKVKDI